MSNRKCLSAQKHGKGTQNGSLEFLKSCLHSNNWLEQTLEIVQHFPPVPFYGDLLKHRSKQLLKNGDIDSAVSHLSDAHCVGLRHRTINIHHNLMSKKKDLVDESTEDLFHEKEDYGLSQSVTFGKVSFPRWLKQLPPEWTVVQVSELRPGKAVIRELGGPPSTDTLPDLVMVRFPCGDGSRVLLAEELEAPKKGIEGGGLLNELHSILEGNRRANNDFRGHRDMYFKVKQEHHNQLKVLVNSLENWWLGYSKCLLVGELKEAKDVQTLNRLTSSLIKLVKKCHGDVTKAQEHWLHLLLSAYNHLNRQQLIRGLAKTLNLVPRSSVVSDVLKYLSTVEEDLARLKTAQRNPVILVLDKVIQQLPWESMAVVENTPISRVPSLHILHSLALKHGFKESLTVPSPSTDLKLMTTSSVSVNPKLAFYVLNPGQDLPGVQQRLQPILESIWGKKSGVIGTVPVEQEIKQSLTNRDVFLYCGHGSGTKYFSSDHIVKLNCRAAPLLMGCSSGQLRAQGRQVDPTGAAANYLMAGSPSLVGMLWEVTDLDCDRFTVRFLDLWMGARRDQEPNACVRTANLPPPPDSEEPELLRAVTASRQVTKYFLTGAAVVVYGLPLRAKSS